MKPTGNKILVEPIKEPETSSGIFIPESARQNQRHMRGIVLAVGPKVEDIKVDDRVLYAGAITSYGDCQIVAAESVIAVL